MKSGICGCGWYGVLEQHKCASKINPVTNSYDKHDWWYEEAHFDGLDPETAHTAMKIANKILKQKRLEAIIVFSSVDQEPPLHTWSKFGLKEWGTTHRARLSGIEEV